MPCCLTISSTCHGSPATSPLGVSPSSTVAQPPAWAVPVRAAKATAARRAMRLIGLIRALHPPRSGGSLPAHLVALHHAPALAQAARSGQLAGEGAERLLVVGADEEVVLARARGPPRARSAARRRRADRRSATGGTSRGSPATHTVRSDASGASWIPSTRFQATGSPETSVPDARRPAPRRVARVVAGRLVDDAAQVVPPANRHARCRTCASTRTGRRAARRPRSSRAARSIVDARAAPRPFAQRARRSHTAHQANGIDADAPVAAHSIRSGP